MAISGTDELIISRAGTLYRAPVSALPASAAPNNRLSPSMTTDFMTVNVVQDDFIGAAVSSGTNSTAPAAGVVTGNHPGVQLWRSSTTANSGFQYSTGLALILLAGGEVFDIVFRTPAALTANTLRFGFQDSITATAPVDGAWLEIPATGAAVGKTRSNSTESVTATIATLATSTWYHARVTVNAAATSVTFEIFSDAGTSIGSQTLSTNIPTASGRECGVVAIGTNSGVTAADIVNVDYMKFSISRTLVRGASS